MQLILINLGYSLMFCAFMARDILWLRGIIMTAHSTLGTYAWVSGNTSMMSWNYLFVVINAVWVARILRERRPVRLDAEQEAIYRAVFTSMSRRDFLFFWETGVMKRGAGVIVREGETPDELLLLVEGEAVVRAGGRDIARLKPGQFIAEMSFLSGHPASATVEAAGPIRQLAWSQQKLHSLQVCNPKLFMLLQGLLGRDLVHKIRASNTLSA